MILEVCIDSLASARAAIAGGADRLELCSALALGGLTPYTELLRQIRRESNITIRCLMRPRAGDFLYTPEEIQMMATQIRELSLNGNCGTAVIQAGQGDGVFGRRAVAEKICCRQGTGECGQTAGEKCSFATEGNGSGPTHRAGGDYEEVQHNSCQQSRVTAGTDQRMTSLSQSADSLRKTFAMLPYSNLPHKHDLPLIRR